MTDRNALAEALELYLTEYVNDYELRGENEDGVDGCYDPNEVERFIILDAIHGLLADDEFIKRWEACRAAAQALRAEASGPVGLPPLSPDEREAVERVRKLTAPIYVSVHGDEDVSWHDLRILLALADRIAPHAEREGER
jgi:hypothetical protein